MIPLIGGDPATGPATSTRFVLPFAYEPDRWEPVPGARDLHYEFQDSSGGDVWRWRRDYFTPETADVLYGHARWAKLVGRESLGEFTIPGVKGPVRVRVAPAELVLFEWPGRGSDRDRRADTSVLQTGFLVLELFFPDPEHPPWLTDLLRLNNRFRYWRQPWDTHWDDPDPWSYRRFLGQCPVAFVDSAETIGSATPTNAYISRWSALLNLPVRDEDGERWRLFPSDWSTRAERRVIGGRGDDGVESHPDGWIAYADTRTFVWTCAMAHEGGNALREASGLPGAAPASDLPSWIQLINVDDPQDTATSFQREWARPRSYGRWEAQGTFYGFAYHAAAMLGPPLNDPLPALWRTFGSVYFDQVLLLLYLRVTTFRFSRELSGISSRALREGFENFSAQFRDLRWLFALFTNLYEFPLLSQQQQAIEMYGLARKHMDVSELFEEIRQEIQSSHEFVDVTLQGQQTLQATRLTRFASRLGVVATAVGGGALLTGFFGMNILHDRLWHACELPWLRDVLGPGAYVAVAWLLCMFKPGSWRVMVAGTAVTFILIWLVAYYAEPIARLLRLADTPSIPTTGDKRGRRR